MTFAAFRCGIVGKNLTIPEIQQQESNSMWYFIWDLWTVAEKKLSTTSQLRKPSFRNYQTLGISSQIKDHVFLIVKLWPGYYCILRKPKFYSSSEGVNNHKLL